jgi:serine/threonine-protein kinase TTK/MPS1
VNGKPYVKLACVGKGGSSKVFKVMSKDLNIYALKRVSLQAEPTILQTYLNEIDILKQLKKHKTIIHYIDAEINQKEEVLFIVSIPPDTALITTTSVGIGIR